MSTSKSKFSDLDINIDLAYRQPLQATAECTQRGGIRGPTHAHRTLIRVVLRRLAAGVPILLFLSFFVFVLVDLAPGDPAVQLAGENATDEQIEAIRHDLHLDDSLPERYGRWLGNAVQGDFGDSVTNGQDVWTAITDKVPISFSIAAVALVFSIVFGVGAGVAAALRSGRPSERVITGAAALLIAVPSFVLALVLVMQFAVERDWLPAIGYVPLVDNPWEWLRHLVLPGLALSTYLAAEIALQLRAALLETLDRDFIVAARARGLSSSSIVFKHAARTAALPVITIVGLRVGLLFGGTVIVETIFVMNGVGTLAVTATRGQDINMLLGILMLVAVAILVVNVIVDITCGFLNPRLRTRQQT
jgi:peptide/nickel transport system permease protein